MDKEFRRLKIKPDLSTVHERDMDDVTETLTNENIKKLNKRVESNKRALLQQYVDSDSDDDNDWDVSNINNLKLNQNLRSKVDDNNNMVTIKEYNPRNISTSSTSSKTVSSIRSMYSENDTDKSDYALEYDDVDYDLDLLQILKKKQTQARNEMLAQHALRRVENQSRNNNRSPQRYQTEADVYNSEDSDFENDANIDLAKLQRFNISPSKLNSKKSLPVMNNYTGLNGSPRKVKRFQSNTDLSMGRNMRYPIFTGRELDEIDDEHTLSPYRKREKQSHRQKIDLKQYQEPTSYTPSKKRNTSNLRASPFHDSKTSRLTKEGKLRLIRSLGKPKVRKVMNGHLYGELVYDPQLLQWRGNEEELTRFDSISKSIPKLINHNKSEIPQVVGDMIYDNKKLKWVNVNGNYDDDPFGDDFELTFREPVKRSEGRGISGRLVPSESTLSLSKALNKNNNFFKVTPDMYKTWKNEEDRWIRKVGNWFPSDSNPHDFKYELKVFLDRQ